MFKNPFSFNGRIRRTEYGISYIIYIAIIIGYVLIFDASNQVEAGSDASPLLFLIWIPLFFFLLAQGAKRCHDMGKSGWWQMIPFYALWMLFQDSEVGVNEYGPNPKGIGNFDEVDDLGSHLAT